MASGRAGRVCCFCGSFKTAIGPRKIMNLGVGSKRRPQAVIGIIRTKLVTGNSI